MADDTLAHSAHFVLTQESQMESQMSQYADNLQTTHITIIEALHGVKVMYQDDAMLPKPDFVTKYIEQYDEHCLRCIYLYSIVKRRKGVLLPNLAERKQSDGIKDKLVKDVYDIFIYGEGVRESFPKNLFSSSGRHVENSTTKQNAEETVNLTQQQEMKEQLEAFFVNYLNEFKAIAFHEILKCRNEITDSRNELRAVLKEKVSERTKAAPPIYLGTSEVSAKKNTVNELQPILGPNVELEVSQCDISDDDSGKKKEKFETVVPKAKQGNILLASDSLSHKLDIKRFFVKGQKTVKLPKSGDTAKGVGHRAIEYIDKKNGEIFEAVVLLGGTNDISKKKADIESAAKELTESAQKLSEKSNVKRVFICKVPPRLDSEANDLKVSHFNQLIADFVTERNNENLVMVETVNKEI